MQRTGVDTVWQPGGKPTGVLWLAGHIQLTSIEAGRSWWWWWWWQPTLLIVVAHPAPTFHSEWIPNESSSWMHLEQLTTSVASDESDISGWLIKPERYNRIPVKCSSGFHQQDQTAKISYLASVKVISGLIYEPSDTWKLVSFTAGSPPLHSTPLHSNL